MPDLTFAVESAEAVPHSVTPLINFRLAVTNLEPDEAIQSVALRCQIQIETVRRQYSSDEQARLLDLYGEPERWGQTLKTLLWTHCNVMVPGFKGRATIDLPVSCTFDFNLATTKYLDGLEIGDLPLCLLFSGTVFYHDSAGSLQVTQISWEKEARYRMPVEVWKKMMDLYYPNSAWLNIRKDVFDKLQAYKMGHSITGWEETIERLLQIAGPVLPAAVRSNGAGRKV